MFLTILSIAAAVVFGDNNQTASTPVKVSVSSQATGVLLIRPGHDRLRVAQAQPVVGVVAKATAAEPSFELNQVAQLEGITTSARVAVGKRSANAVAQVNRVELFGGRIVLSKAKLSASARSSQGRAGGEVVLDTMTTMEVDGVSREVGLNERIAIEGIGTVIVNEQAVVANAPKGDKQTGPRFRVVGALVHVRITKDVLGLKAGSELIIGRVDTAIREGKVRSAQRSGPAQPQRPPNLTTTAYGLQRGEPRPGETTLPRRPTAVRAALGGTQTGSLRSYLFPVLGKSSYSNDWGAARASTGIPHQGTDIFATEGTPIVAVADGVLDRVGWNPIGGYRFWLFDQFGNAFYHAHMSAYSPIAFDGARVRRGDVIGFVGHTGDAQYTPPHLHFQIHPGNGDATNPFPYLNAWKQGKAVAIGLASQGVDRISPLALLSVSDISSASGLNQDVLSRVPDTRQRAIEQETEPRPSKQSLKGALSGPATSAEQ